MLTHLTSIIIHIIQSSGYFGIFLLMTLESVFIPIPSEVTMPFGGFLAQQGSLSLPLVILAGALGNLLGSVMGYGIGFVLEERVLLGFIQRYGKYVLFSEEDYHSAKSWFTRFGDPVVFVSRLLPAVRTFISLPAGVFQMSRVMFCVYTFVGSLIWSAALAAVGYYLGSNWETLGPIFSKFQLLVVVAFIALVAWYIYHKLHKIRRVSVK